MNNTTDHSQTFHSYGLKFKIFYTTTLVVNKANAITKGFVVVFGENGVLAKIKINIRININFFLPNGTFKLYWVSHVHFIRVISRFIQFVFSFNGMIFIFLWVGSSIFWGSGGQILIIRGK